jgi:hypothetical protein
MSSRGLFAPSRSDGQPTRISLFSASTGEREDVQRKGINSPFVGSRWESNPCWSAPPTQTMSFATATEAPSARRYFAALPALTWEGLERDGLAKYLIPSDAEAEDLYSSALPMDELQTILGRIEAERVVAFLDACYSGAAGGRTFSSRRTRSAAIDELFLERLTRSRGRAIITASRPTEVSIELPELGHGIFTYYLVQGLKGAADLNKDGIISLQELYEYVEQQVTAKSRAVGGNQHPVMKGEMEGVLPLAKAPVR